MDPHEALRLLDQAVAQLRTDRESHMRLAQAVKTIADALNPPAPARPAKATE